MAHRSSDTVSSDDLSASLLGHQTHLGESDNGKEIEEPDQTRNRGSDNEKMVDKSTQQYPWKRDFCKPSLVSIGPKYSKEVEKKKNEDYKNEHFKSFLERKVGQSETIDRLKEYGKCLEHPEVQLKAKAYYKDLGITCPEKDEEFVKMLLIDGCFVVEFVLKCKDGGNGDPRLSEDGRKARVDMLRFENQLPFEVLTTLYGKTTGCDTESFKTLVKFAFASLAPNFTPSNFFDDHKREEPKDILDVVYSLCLPSKAPKESHSIFLGCFRHHVDDANRLTLQHINSATELREVGVSFKNTGKVYIMPREYEKISSLTKRDSTSLFDINFSGGVMSIPCFKVDDSTEIFFRNMIAFEQRCRNPKEPKYYTDYARLMDHLVDTNKDVALLRKTGTIHNFLGEDKKVANMFNNVSVTVDVSTDFHFAPVYTAVNGHCRNICRVWMAKLKYDYFYNPWKGISTVVGVIILLLGAALTVKSLLS